MLDFLRRLFSAAPDAVTALVFAAAWVAPLHWGRDLVGNLMLVMMLEFLVVHSGGFIGMAVVNPEVGRRAKTLAVLGFGAFYMLFALAFALAFHRLWAVWAFTWLLGSKLATVWLSPAAPTREVERQKSLWGLSVALYVLGVFVTVILPLPRLGITPEVVAQLGIPGSGLWVERPHTVIAFGLLYFGALAAVKARLD
jgi:hypothetical protein